MIAKPLLVGESNPHGCDPHFALYPLPEGSAGWRLCKLVLGLDRGAYLRAFDRVNLCAGAWSIREARTRASALRVERREQPDAPIILLGAKVADAFGADYVPFGVTERFTSDGALAARFAVLPHPSGRCRLWNAPDAYERAREVLRRVGALPATRESA